MPKSLGGSVPPEPSFVSFHDSFARLAKSKIKQGCNLIKLNNLTLTMYICTNLCRENYGNCIYEF